MPKGVPKSGFRVRRKGPNAGKPIIPRAMRGHSTIVHLDTSTFPVFKKEVKEETEEEIAARLRDRFGIMESMVRLAIEGDATSIIISGPAGLGKSHTVETLLKEYDPDEENSTIVKGYARATGLYKVAYQNREKGKILVLDDADKIFSDETSLNILKALCDSGTTRRVSWLSEALLIDEENGEPLPKHFEFAGTVIFITNYDFDEMIVAGTKLAPHMQALMSRSHYIDLTMKTPKDYMVRIKQVAQGGMLRAMGLSANEEADVLGWMQEHMEELHKRDLSLRTALKLAMLRRSKPTTWRTFARITCCKE